MQLDEMDSEEGSMILEEEIDPNYVPTKEGSVYALFSLQFLEIEEYAESISWLTIQTMAFTIGAWGL